MNETERLLDRKSKQIDEMDKIIERALAKATDHLSMEDLEPTKTSPEKKIQSNHQQTQTKMTGKNNSDSL